MAKSNHIITFLQRAQKFAWDETITSELKVDKDNTVEDVFDVADTTGGVIAEIDNACAEIIWKLEEYYKATNNKKILQRLSKLR